MSLPLFLHRIQRFYIQIIKNFPRSFTQVRINLWPKGTVLYLLRMFLKFKVALYFPPLLCLIVKSLKARLLLYPRSIVINFRAKRTILYFLKLIFYPVNLLSKRTRINRQSIKNSFRRIRLLPKALGKRLLPNPRRTCKNLR